jgi:hypothetical protein
MTVVVLSAHRTRHVCLSLVCVCCCPACGVCCSPGLRRPTCKALSVTSLVCMRQKGGALWPRLCQRVSEASAVTLCDVDRGGRLTAW